MTRRKFISDSTPLIALARIGQLELVRRVFGEIFVSDAIHEETVEARGGAPGADEVAGARWVRRLTVDPESVTGDECLALRTVSESLTTPAPPDSQC
jgi:predicted nucleic acid-binding protein